MNFDDLRLRVDNDIVDALITIWTYGQIDGSHHKMWVLDQVVRQLLKDYEYDQFVSTYEEDGEYSWDTGVAP